jgi:hypothetical protein
METDRFDADSRPAMSVSHVVLLLGGIRRSLKYGVDVLGLPEGSSEKRASSITRTLQRKVEDGQAHSSSDGICIARRQSQQEQHPHRTEVQREEGRES